ncbi:MAG: MBL fold metallo-hydrolase [Pyrinomonadaceae bacterium]
MLIEKFTITPFQQNTRVVACGKTSQAIVIDPGEESQELNNFLRDNSLNLVAVALTHGHLDHAGGTAALKRAFPEAEVVIHKDDEDLYLKIPRQPLAMGIPASQLKALGLDYEDPPPPTRYWEHGEKFHVGELEFDILHCPGHTPGHVVLAERNEQKVFVGDCLFLGSIGRTDLPGGSYEQLLDSIETNILGLGDDFVVYSGHGPETTVGHERATNPFLTGAYGRGRFI